MKKFVCFALCLVLLLSLAACNKNKAVEGGRMDLSHEDSMELQEGAAVNVQSIYNSMEYTPHMFFGWYEIYGQTEDEFHAASTFMTIEHRGEELSLTTLPHGWMAGAGTFSHIINRYDDHFWGEFYFQTESGYLDTMICAYEVEGHTLKLYPLKTYSYDKETDVAEYTLHTEPLVYEFSFSGPNVTLSANGQSVTVRAYEFLEDHALHLYNYMTTGSARLDGIELIDLYSCDTEESYERFTLTLENGDRLFNANGYLTEDGLFSYCWSDESGKVYNGQYVYFWCGDDGMIFSDGTKNYYYNDSTWAHYKSLLSTNVEEEDLAIVETMPEEEIKTIEEKRTSLFEDLSAAFTEAGLDIRVDAATGEIMLDSAVLFDTSSAELSDEGKEFLNAFLAVYTSVLFGEEYDGFVKKVIVEGHADPRGTYEINQTLSEDRAASVMNWCISGDNGLAAEYLTILSGSMESVGYSSDYPIYDENGNVDNDASRRVAFRFIINIE